MSKITLCKQLLILLLPLWLLLPAMDLAGQVSGEICSDGIDNDGDVKMMMFTTPAIHMCCPQRRARRRPYPSR
jgi:hypothetical protein